MNKWYNYGKWRHPEKRKELMKDREEKITADTRLNRLKDDIRTEFDKIKWMIDEHIQVQDKQIKLQKPIYEKALAAIKKVSDAKGLSYTIDATSPGTVLNIGTGSIDILADVKKELGF